jgi:GR25 family glycosyltransferase involved in LPS biosynthesis
MNLTDYFSKVFVINLDKNPERWDAFQERAAEKNITGFQRFRAVHGDVCRHPAWWRAGNGAWGCLMSHAGIAQEALMDNLDNYLVLEDDVVFSSDFCDRLPLVMKAIQGDVWDQLYLGGQHLYKETSPPWPYADGVVRCLNVNRTHAMAINRRFMLKFYQHILHAPDYLEKHLHPDPVKKIKEWFPHIDHQLGYLHERKNHVILATNPWLCGQAAGPSQINGQVKREEWWNDQGWYK